MCRLETRTETYRRRFQAVVDRRRDRRIEPTAPCHLHARPLYTTRWPSGDRARIVLRPDPPTAGAHVTPAGGLIDTSTGPRAATGALSREHGAATSAARVSARRGVGYNGSGVFANGRDRRPLASDHNNRHHAGERDAGDKCQHRDQRCAPPCRRSCDRALTTAAGECGCGFGTSGQQVFDFESSIGDVRQTSRAILLEAAPQQLAKLRRRRSRQD